MYSIIGGDSKTYGPVTADEVHRWIREGRADERTKVKEEGSTEWRELGTISAFFPALANVPPKISGRAGLNTVAAEGSVHIGDCLRQGWQVYRQDPWRITGIIVIVFVAQFLLNSIPIAGALFAFLLNGPILGGVYFFCMQAIHGQTHGLQDVTSTIKERFLPCFLATTVSSLLAFAPLLVALIPAAGLFAASGVVMEELVKHPNLILGIGLPLLAGALAMFYLLICWSFAVPIAACTNTDFWEALKLSWRGVRKNFWAYFGLLLALGLINLIGILCLVVGLFVTIPFTFLATMVAYEQIFRTTHSR
jgi:uncharacterized membrane protein